jgi:hypothetical protein
MSFTQWDSTCEECCWFDGVAKDASKGFCRRYPPVLWDDVTTKTIEFTIPMVPKKFSCGEFKAE